MIDAILAIGVAIAGLVGLGFLIGLAILDVLN